MQNILRVYTISNNCALLLIKIFPAVLKTPSDGVFENDMQKVFLAKEVSDR